MVKRPTRTQAAALRNNAKGDGRFSSLSPASLLADRLSDVIVHPDEIEDVLRRTRLILMARIVFPDRVVDTAARRPAQDRRAVAPAARLRGLKVEPAVGRLAAALIAAPPGAILTHDALLAAIAINSPTKKLLRVTICKLRLLMEKAGVPGEALRTIYNYGYVLEPDFRGVVAVLSGLSVERA